MFRGAIVRSDNNIFLNKNRYYFIKRKNFNETQSTILRQ